MRTCLWIIFVSLILAGPTAAQDSAKLEGRVVDGKGNPLPYVNVFFGDGDYAGDITDSSGFFLIQSRNAGSRTLVASFVGYETVRRKIFLPGQEPVWITLFEKAIELKEIQIQTSAYTAGEGNATVSRIDVYTTPGGAADVFQSLKVLPGVIQSDETAAIPVRGGSPNENLVLLNGAVLNHPYHAEGTGRGGLFSVVETAALKRLYFSSGGFSVRYGNALSGVIDIETEKSILQNRFSISANFVGFGAGAQLSLIPDRLNVQLFAKKTTTDLLFQINNPTVDVVEDPATENLIGMVNYHYSGSGTIEVMGMAANDHQKFNIRLQSNASRYRLSSGHQIVSAGWQDVFREKWISKAAVSFSGYRNDWKFGGWHRDNHEYNVKIRTDQVLQLSDRWLVSAGSEVITDQYDFNALLPRRPWEFYEGADTISLDGKDGAVLTGHYLEVDRRLGRTWSVSSGIRLNTHSISNKSSVDLRSAAVRQMSEHDFLRLAFGSFHQYPDITLYDPTFGNPGLEPMRAIHLIAGYEHQSDRWQMKIEPYYKWYSQLPIEDDVRNYTSRGAGFARGIDFFLKGRLRSTSGWISYSYIRTRRKELDVPEARPTVFDITHNLSVVAKHRLPALFEISGTLRLATGRPFTPVEGASQDPTGFWVPSYGRKFSDRLPAYRRLDMRLSRLMPFGSRTLLVAYLEVLNVFGTDNVLSYSYSDDFLERNEIESYFSNRTAVLGAALSF